MQTQQLTMNGEKTVISQKVRRITAVILALLMLVGIFSQSSSFAASTTDNKNTIYKYLVNTMEFNTAAACGVLANIEYESAFNPNKVGDQGTSYGICQWHRSRKTQLISYCEANGYDYTQIDGQLHYLNYELKKSYPSVYNYLKSVSNNADGAYNAAYYWCYYYEIPDNKAAESVYRGRLAKNTYWPAYGEGALNGKTPSSYKVAYSRALKLTSPNMQGNDVKYMQACLQYLGYSVTIDGYYGSGTVSVVKKFQSAKGLTADGICGSITWNAIESAVFSNGTALSITTQPKSATLNSGDRATFSVKAKGSGLSYQWYYKKKSGSSWSAWKTTASFSCETNDSWDGFQAYCVVKDGSGATVKSDTMTLTLKIPLAITAQPQSATVTSGNTAKFSVTARGNGLSYQWYYKKKGASSWTAWKTTASFTCTTNDTWNGFQAYCVVKDSSGAIVKSNTMTLTVKPGTITLSPTPLSITAQPKSATLNSGDRATFSVTAKGSGLSYQWYYKKSGASSWTAWKTTASFTAESNDSWNGFQAYCVVKDSSGASVKSNTMTLTVKVPLSITAQPQSATVTSGGTAKFSVTARGSGLSYQWYYKKSGASSWTKWKTTAGFTCETNDSWDGFQAYCVVKDSSGASVKSNTMTLTVKVPLSITAQPQSTTIPSGGTAKFSVGAKGSGLSYQWYFKKSGASSWTKWKTVASFTCETNDSWNGFQAYCVVTDKYGSTVKSNTMTVTFA